MTRGPEIWPTTFASTPKCASVWTSRSATRADVSSDDAGRLGGLVQDGRVREPVLDVLARDVVEERQRVVDERVLRDERRRLGVDERRHGQRNDVAGVVADDVGIDLLGVDRLPAARGSGGDRRSGGPVVERRLPAARAARLRSRRLHPVAGAAEDRAERRAREQERADEQQQDPEDGRAGRAERQRRPRLRASDRDSRPGHGRGRSSVRARARRAPSGTGARRRARSAPPSGSRARRAGREAPTTRRPTTVSSPSASARPT